MNWTINLAGVLLLTNITGSAAFMLWILMSHFLKKWGYVQWCKSALWGVSWLHLLPIVYGMMVQGTDNGGWGGVMFMPTLKIIGACRIIGLIWGAGVGILLVRLSVAVVAQNKIGKELLPCEKETQKLYEAVCRELEIPADKTALYQSYHAEMPAVMGILHPRVVLPVQEFTEEQLRIIFLHELTHYKQRDLPLKWLAAIVKIVHWYHPLAWILSVSVRWWSELACDVRVYSLAGGKKRYFNIIFDVMCTSKLSRGIFAMYMAENEDELVRRKKSIRELEKIKRKSVLLAALLTTVMVTVCSVTVLAASDRVGDQYRNWYRRTVIEVRESMQASPAYEDDLVEYIKAETGEEEKIVRDTTNISLSTGADTMKKTSGFSAKSGQQITISFKKKPADMSLKVGIVDSSGNRRYVMKEGSIYKEFIVFKTDTYKVFVENGNAQSVDAEGTYAVRNER